MPDFSTVRITQKQVNGSRPHGLALGIVYDAVRVTDAAITSGDNVLTCSPSAPFLVTDVGRAIVVEGAGVSGLALVGVISSVIGETQVTVSVDASTTVSGVRAVFGTENSAAFDHALQEAMDHGNSLYLDGGGFLTTGQHRITGNLKIYGACHRLDVPHTKLSTGSYSCIFTVANPAIYVDPYPGVEFRDIIFEGLGAKEEIDIYEQAGYSGQVCVWAGYAGAPLTLPEDDYGAGPGSGGLTMKGCTFSNFSGWGVVGYKLYGKSLFDRCRFYRCGELASTATEDEKDRHGGIQLNSESVDIDITNCHFLGPFSGTNRSGTAIKLGSKSTDAAAMNRFYLGCSHITVTNCLVEGNWFSGTSEYMAIASTFMNMVYGNVQYIRIGENPWVSALNCTGWWRNIDLSGPGIVVYVYAERVVLDGFHSETSAAKEIRYYYSGPVIKNCKNISLVPSGAKAQITRNSELWDNRPLAFVDEPHDSINLVPNYQKTSAWTISGSNSVRDRWNLKLFSGGTASTTITGLTVGAVYTFGFRHQVPTTAFADLNTYRLEDGSAVEIIANQIGETALEIPLRETFIMLNFVAPADGTVKIIFKNDDTNLCNFDAPWIVKGFASAFKHGGYEWMGNPQNGLVTGRAMDSAGYWEHFDTVMSRKFGGFGVSLTARDQARVGLGSNMHYDGTEWVTGHDSTDNAASALLTRMVDGAVQLYAVPTTATGQPQKLTGSQLDNNIRLQVETNDRLVQYGDAAAEHNIVQKKRGQSREFRMSHRTGGTQWLMVYFDGTSSWIPIDINGATSTILINGVDVTNLFPSGATAGMFLRSSGGTARVWAKVDVGDATNVQAAGFSASRYAMWDGSKFVPQGPADVWLFIQSLVNANAQLGSTAQVTGLDAILDDLQAQINDRSPLGHGHTISGTTSTESGHAHTVSGSTV